jgi:hypothetical protein
MLEWLKGLAALALAFGFDALQRHGLHKLALALVGHLHLNPQSHWPALIVGWSEHLQQVHPGQVVSVALVYAPCAGPRAGACGTTAPGPSGWRRSAPASTCPSSWRTCCTARPRRRAGAVAERGGADADGGAPARAACVIQTLDKSSLLSRM